MDMIYNLSDLFVINQNQIGIELQLVQITVPKTRHVNKLTLPRGN